MDMNSTINALKEEQLCTEETDNSCQLKITDVVSLARHTYGSYATEHVSEDGHDEVKQEDVEQEPIDVLEYLFYHTTKEFYRSLVTD